jgi:hypothetical protein
VSLPLMCVGGSGLGLLFFLQNEFCEAGDDKRVTPSTIVQSRTSSISKAKFGSLLYRCVG